MQSTHTKITYKKRKKIEEYYNIANLSKLDIAKILGVSRQAVSKEINEYVRRYNEEYNADKAQDLYEEEKRKQLEKKLEENRNN